MSVTIEVFEDIVAVPVAPSVGGRQSNGVAFQLNCLPLLTQNVTTWQQYIIAISRTGQQLGWSIDNWNSGGGDGFVNLSGSWGTIGTDLPAGYAHIPSGSMFEIELQIDQTSHNVTGAIYSTSFNGKSWEDPVSVQITATGNLNSLNQQQLNIGDLSPIADLTLDIVGYANGASTLLTSGAGRITYTADQSLVTAGGPPGCTYGDGTLESSNVTYGELPDGPSKTFTQPFGYLPASSYVAVQGPRGTLDLYSQPIGGSGWPKQPVAGPGSAYSSPALTFANYKLAPWIAVQGPEKSLTFYWWGNSRWNPEPVAGRGTTMSAPSIAEFHANHICIAARGSDNSLMVYWQQIGKPGWQPQTVAPAGMAVSAPSLTQVDNRACIAVMGPGGRLDFYWQDMGDPGWPGTVWTWQQVAKSNTTFSSPSLAQIGDAACIAVMGLDSKLEVYWHTIDSAAGWSPPRDGRGVAIRLLRSVARPDRKRRVHRSAETRKSARLLLADDRQRQPVEPVRDGRGREHHLLGPGTRPSRKLGMHRRTRSREQHDVLLPADRPPIPMDPRESRGLGHRTATRLTGRRAAIRPARPLTIATLARSEGSSTAR